MTLTNVLTGRTGNAWAGGSGGASVTDETPVTATGGVEAATLADRFGRILNVKDDFGATGDGTTNDTQALQAAIDAGAGRALFFPPGTYRTARLQIGAGDARQIVGVPGQSILKTIDTDIAEVQLLSMSGVTDVDIDGLGFDGNASALTNFQNVVQIFNSQRIRFRRCTFQNTRGITLLLSTSIQNCLIADCRFLNCGITGGVGGANRKQAIAFVGATTGGTDSYGNQVLNNTFENTGLDCVSWADQNYGQVSGNRMSVIGAAAVYCWNSRHTVISNNIIRTGGGVAGPYAVGIDVPSSDNITVTGNICYECSADGIGIYTTSTRCVVSGNTCINNDQDNTVVKRAGIVVCGSGHTITGNVCTDTQTVKTQDYGILIDTAATNIVIDESNNLFGNGVAEIGYVNRTVDLSAVTATAKIGRLAPTNDGTSIVLTAAGSETNLDVRITPKGTGAVRFGTHTANADVAITGYVTIKDASGTIRKLAVIP